MGIPGVTGGKIAQFTNEFGGPALTDKLNNELANAWAGFDALAPKASDIFETRTATRIFDSHQEFAVKNVEGSATPEFNENENLYGFTIFQFKSGFIAGGWSPAVINSLLGFDLSTVTGASLGGDKIGNVNSYFFNLHPSNISLSEPFTTQLIPTQGGGVYAESQGSILRSLTLSGTTGYRPGIAHAPSNRLDNVIPWTPDEPTGYLNFLKLRNVFRNYSDLKKNNSQAYKTYMVWYNNKEQEAWFFEPSSFSTNRDASSPFTYNYSISGTLTQKVNFSTVVNTINPDPKSPHYHVAMMRKSASLLNGALSLIPGVGDNAVGEALQAASSFLSLADDLDRLITNVGDIGGGLIGTVPLVANAVGAAAWDVSSKVYNVMRPNFNDVFGADGTATVWSAYADTKFGENFLNIYKNIRDIGKEAMALAQPEVLAEVSRAQPDPVSNESNSIVPKTDLSYGSSQVPSWDGWDLIPYTVSEDDESLEDIASKTMGDDGGAPTIAEINGLDYPYISGTPGYQTGNNSFISAGQVIYIPYPKEVTSGDINTKININKVTGNLNQQVLGRDIQLIKSTHGTTGVSEFSLSINPNGDLAIISGKDNMVQAIDIKLNTERGELSPHPEFGIVPVVGHKGTNNLTFNLYLSLNDTMLSDGRIKELTDTTVSVSGGTATVKTKVNVVGRLPAIPLRFSMGQ